MSEPDYAAANRRAWNEWAADYAARAEAQWAEKEGSWGIWKIPEGRVGLLAGVAGKDVLEDGCGTGYVSAWMARRGARPVGIDNSPAQLATARRMQRRFGLRFPLLHGVAERLPFADASFDRVVSEYGAAIWSDPYAWVPEAARVLRRGGDLVFLGNAYVLMLCMPAADADLPAGRTLVRDHFDMHRVEWDDDPSIEFHLPHGKWIELFRDCGLEVLELRELRAPEGAETVYDFVEPAWARRWPSEEVWRVRKR
ncbi:MAG: class I SAM-dependent methyltransferase [Thermoanaerobaculia bacterium]|nr:class I SAM-dependent methyltransferase [Thermoanaerobaculia bacterium]